MNKIKVAIVDYGSGNLLSVQRAFEFCGAHALITSSAAEILAADKVVLPGVGAFKNAMLSLNGSGLSRVINQIVASAKPLLGICLGMQLLFEKSEEFGECQGLGFIPGFVTPIPVQNTMGAPLKTPHIGWAEVDINLNQHKSFPTLFVDIKNKSEFYFVHSYAANTNSEFEVATSIYGGHKILAIAGYENIIGCQFHPEKSGVLGLNLIRNFCGY